MTAPTRRPVVPAGPKLAARAAASRRDRRGTVLRRIAYGTGATAVAGALAWLLLASSWLAVQRVQVSGQGRVSQAQVLAAVGPVDGRPLARVDLAAVSARLRRLPPVASVTVTRGWPHVLRVHLFERTPYAGVVQAGQVRLLDDTGLVFATERSLPRGVVRLDVARPGAADPATVAALAVLHELPPALSRQLMRVTAATPEQVVLVLRDGRQIVWGGAGGVAQKVAETLALLKMPGRVDDVSAPGVATRR